MMNGAFILESVLVSVVLLKTNSAVVFRSATHSHNSERAVLSESTQE